MQTPSPQSQKRIQNLRKARTINEVAAILKEIALSIKLAMPRADKFLEAVSSGHLKSNLSSLVENIYENPQQDAGTRLCIAPDLLQRQSLSARTQPPSGAAAKRTGGRGVKTHVAPTLRSRVKTTPAPAKKRNIPREQPLGIPEDAEMLDGGYTEEEFDDTPIVKKTPKAPRQEPAAPTGGRGTEEITFVRDGSNLDFAEVTPTPTPRSKKVPGIPLVLDDFEAPSTKELMKHNEALNTLYDNSLELKQVIEFVEQSPAFANDPNAPAVLKATRLLFQSVDDKLGEAFGALADLGRDHMPTPMQKLAKEITSHLTRAVPKERYKKRSAIEHVESRDGALYFSYYIEYANLKSNSGFIFNRFYIVLTGKVVKETLSMYVNSLPEFKLPGRYAVGPNVTQLPPKTVNQFVDEFFAQNEVSLELDRLAMPVTKPVLKSSGITNVPGVKTAYVFDDGLRVSLKPGLTESQKTSLAAKIMLELNRLIGNTSRKSRFAYKIKQAGATEVYEFVVIGGKGSNKLKRSDLYEIQELLGLTDKQISYIRDAQRGEE